MNKGEGRRRKRKERMLGKSGTGIREWGGERVVVGKELRNGEAASCIPGKHVIGVCIDLNIPGKSLLKKERSFNTSRTEQRRKGLGP